MARCSSYIAGQCTAGACYAEGWIPDHLGNAVDWYANAQQQGLAVTDVPTVNAVAVWLDARRYNTPYGHCGIVQAVTGYDRYKVLEMNFTAAFVYDQRWTDRAGLLGFILPPGVAPGTGASGPLPAPPASHQLEAAWDGLAAFWNYVIDVQTLNLERIALAMDNIH